MPGADGEAAIEIVDRDRHRRGRARCAPRPNWSSLIFLIIVMPSGPGKNHLGGQRVEKIGDVQRLGAREIGHENLRDMRRRAEIVDPHALGPVLEDARPFDRLELRRAGRFGQQVAFPVAPHRRPGG